DEEIVLAFDMCASEDGYGEQGITLKSIPQMIERQEDLGYLAIVKVAKDVMPGKYVCTLQAGIPNTDTGLIVTDLPFHSRQVSIEVK
ncbi:hypothetical protein JW711_04795, partial [Candidatus Woesearchaeota archaeon]|nr:hypothetical protein [Candidatus Woesearchaeota archaeon]